MAAATCRRGEKRERRRILLITPILLISFLSAAQFLDVPWAGGGFQNFSSPEDKQVHTTNTTDTESNRTTDGSPTARPQHPTFAETTIDTNNHRTTEGSSTARPQNPTFAETMCVFTKTAPRDSQMRQCQRNKCRSRFDNDPILHMFVMGTPSFEARMVRKHQQGQLASTEEMMISGSIIDEEDQYRDILVVPFRDCQDESAKQLAALKYGVDHNCSYTILTDARFCVNITQIRNMIATAQNQKQHPNEQVYFGYQLHKLSSIHAPFLSGYSGVSHILASFIVHQDWTHSVMKVHYGSRSSEDSNMGLWVDYAIKKHNVTVKYIAETSDATRGNDTSSLEEMCPENRESVKFKHKLCILTMTRADGFDTRQCQRSQCRPSYGDVPHRFVVGVPSYTEKEDPLANQTAAASNTEIEVAGKIIKEDEQFGDIVATVHNDYYIDLPEKRMAILKFGVENKCAYTVKVDDEFCVNITVVRQLIEAHERDRPNEDLYFGIHKWSGTEDPRMKGVNGTSVPYMSGWCNGASYRLASYIVNEDWTHTVMRANYASSSEDVDMGFWVDFAMKTHNLPVTFVTNKTIISKIPEDACHAK